MLKNKIKSMILEGRRIKPSKFEEKEIKEILKQTEFLGEVNFSENVYNYINNIKEEIKCKECGLNKPKFLRISTGYRDFCCNSCKNKWIYENTDLKERISKSSKNTYNKFTISEIRQQQNKRLQTMINRNIISSLEDRSYLNIYYREVWRYTNQNNLKQLKNYNKRGRLEILGSYQLDHMFSISEGFRQKIPPYIIGNINNLKMIPSIKNSSKKQKCSITIEEIMTAMSKN